MCIACRLLFVVALLVSLHSCRTVAPESNIPSPLISDQAMVVTAHPEASRVGLRILQQGGNAVDAAVAVQFALAVVYPVAGNIGGGGFLVSRQADGTVHSLDFREAAPAAAHRDMYLDESGEADAEKSQQGHLAVGVPGTVAGMFQAHDSLGLLPMARLIQPAIELAAQGFPLTERDARRLNRNTDRFRRLNTVSSVFTEREEWTRGDTLRQADLARTLSRIRDQGRAGFYQGETAALLIAEMQRGQGIISLADLADYQAKWRSPIRGRYREYELISMGPPSSGGIALIQLLQTLAYYDLATMGFQSPAAVHIMAEAERRVYADRATHLGDPDYYPVPIVGLLESAYNRGRMSNFDPDTITPSEQLYAGQPGPAESMETTHFSIVDAAGNAVSLTTTINGGFGAGVVVGGAGFFLNNEMDDFSAKPGTPNMFGLLGAEANAIEPGKRMLSSMTPTIVEKNGALYLVLGTPGGATIITSVFQSFVNVVEFGQNMQEAVSQLRFHHQWKPDQLQYEPDCFNESQIQSLQALGHSLKVRSPYGSVNAIRVLPTGQLEAGADPRGDNTAQGY